MNPPFPLLVCKPGEKQPMEASKWLNCQVLLDEHEMQSLFSALDPFHIFLTGVVVKPGEGEISQKAFLECYAEYVQALRNGQVPLEKSYRPYFSASLTIDPQGLFAVDAGERQIIRVARPAIQLQSHMMGYSKVDGKFRSMILGKDTFLWGIQFSYPQLYHDLTLKEALKVDDSPAFPNTKIFRQLQRWMREATIPTPFLVNGTIINVPARLGKRCLSWINQHPQLTTHHLKIVFQ